MSEKVKLERLLTPVGEAMWAHVHVPKKPFEDKGEAKFMIDVVFDPKDPAWAPWVDGLRKQLAALPVQTNKATGEKMPKQSPVKRELDAKDEPTGRLIATFKTSERFKPGVFDKFKRPIPPTILIGNGSKVKVAYSPNTYDAFGGGINFYLNAIQVLELVKYQAQSADNYGFTGEELKPGEADPYAEANAIGVAQNPDADDPGF